jgi:hypothetical protein
MSPSLSPTDSSLSLGVGASIGVGGRYDHVDEDTRRMLIFTGGATDDDDDVDKKGNCSLRDGSRLILT